MIGMGLISVACCCVRARRLSGLGENDNGRLPLPSLDENDGVDKRESAWKINFDRFNSFTYVSLTLTKVMYRISNSNSSMSPTAHHHSHELNQSMAMSLLQTIQWNSLYREKKHHTKGLLNESGIFRKIYPVKWIHA